MVKAKKHLGQHFLIDESIAQKIVEALLRFSDRPVLEIGPGTGVLTKYLIQQYPDNLYLIDIDSESIQYLKRNFKDLEGRILEGDFLNDRLAYLKDRPFDVIGNFPYNISSQIFFKILDNRNKVDQVVCMLQKEVAERLVSPPGNKAYGILSVFLQSWYDLEYLFTVGSEVFNPPPKIQSGVIRLQRNNRMDLGCNEALFKRIVKQGFQNRRKTLRNALKPLNLSEQIRSLGILDRRAESLSVDEFVELTKQVEGGEFDSI